MPSFIGRWNTTRYRAVDPANPEVIVLTITEDTTPGQLDGNYPRPGLDARLLGQVDGTGFLWTAQVDENGSSGDVGTAFFVLSADESTIHGAWTSSQHNTGPQPWFGTRI
jgi:hypothetical protein